MPNFQPPPDWNTATSLVSVDHQIVWCRANVIWTLINRMWSLGADIWELLPTNMLFFFHQISAKPLSMVRKEFLNFTGFDSSSKFKIFLKMKLHYYNNSLQMLIGLIIWFGLKYLFCKYYIIKKSPKIC